MQTVFLASSRVQQTLVVILVGAAYYVGAQVGLVLSVHPDHIASFWPPNAIILSALIFTQARRWWIYFALMTLPYLAGDLSVEYSSQRSILCYLASCVEVFIAAAALKYFLRGRLKFDRLREMAIFLLSAALVAPLVSALIAAFATLPGAELDYWQAWRMWLLGSALGNIAVTPVLVLWLLTNPARINDISFGRWLEIAVLVVCIYGVSAILLGAEIGTVSNFPALLYAPMPVLLWAAIRFGPRGVCSAIFVIAVVAIWNAINSRGPFMANTPAENVLSLQLFLIAIAIPTMLLASLLAERRHAQQALLTKEKEQREILDSMLDAVLVTDEMGFISNMNKMAGNLFGYRRDELLGQNINRLMPKSDAREHDAYLGNYRETGVSTIIGTGREVAGLRKNNQVFPMQISVTTLPTDGSGKIRYLGTCHDLTQRKQQEEHLRRSQKMDALGKLSGGIAHDFNNLLSIVTGYSEMLESMLEDQPTLASYANEIRHAGERGARLTKKLLSFSRRDSSEASKVDINNLIRKQREMLQQTLTVRIELTLDLADEVWPTWLDDSELEDAVVNICINAMHAMGDAASGAQLIVSTRNKTLNATLAKTIGLAAGDYVRLGITDTGTGMDAATKEKIFDPFFSTKGEDGTGLGLSQVFGFSKQSGGSINVHSTEGRGSTFELYFPRHKDDDSESLDVSSYAAIDLAGSESILVVDDEAALRQLATEILVQYGYTVFSAANGEQALRILGQEHIDLMLSDIVMPGMDGYQLAALVKKNYPTTLIQLASGFTGDRNAELVDDELQARLLRKPYETRVMLQRVRFLLDT